MDSPDFVTNNKLSCSSFTRERKLGFKNVLMLVLQKSIKSVQIRLNEFFEKLSSDILPATSSAFTQARSNLSHSAFIELNKTCIIGNFYADGDYKTWRNYRLLAVDGSRVVLPPSKEIREHFGALTTTDNKGMPKGEYNAALVSIIYDVLNRVAIDSTLANCRSSEKDLAIGHLKCVSNRDLIIADRGYPSFEYMASIVQTSADFVMRCSKGSFKQAQEMFADESITSVNCTLTPSASDIKRLRELGLPQQLNVRFVKVVLSTGEPEVLVTSLLDNSIVPNDFKELYNLRWGIETYYHVLKSHLTLENFSGYTLESVKQDFYAMVFLTNLETVLVDDAQAVLDSKNNVHKQAVNRAISLNSLKNSVMQLLSSHEDLETVITKLTALFLINPTIKRNGRHVDRKITSQGKTINYYRRKRKIVF